MDITKICSHFVQISQQRNAIRVILSMQEILSDEIDDTEFLEFAIGNFSQYNVILA